MSCQICGVMTVDLRYWQMDKHLNEMSGSFCICHICEKCNLEAGVTSCVHGVTRIDFFERNIACPK